MSWCSAASCCATWRSEERHPRAGGSAPSRLAPPGPRGCDVPVAPRHESGLNPASGPGPPYTWPAAAEGGRRQRSGQTSNTTEEISDEKAARRNRRARAYHRRARWLRQQQHELHDDGRDLDATSANAAIAAQVPAAIKAKGTLNVASEAQYAPNEFIGPDGHTVIGMDADLVHALGAVMGLKMNIVNSNFETIIPGPRGRPLRPRRVLVHGHQGT